MRTRSTDTVTPALPVRDGHFLLESGHHSDVWVDLETLCLRPDAVRPLAVRLASRLSAYPLDAVCGPLNEGAFIALMVATTLRCAFTYAERIADPSRTGLFPVEYRVPALLHAPLAGRRVAIVNDLTSAGSAVRGTFSDLRRAGADVRVIASLWVFGSAIRSFASEHRLALECLEERPHNMWTESECPLCEAGMPLETVTSAAPRI